MYTYLIASVSQEAVRVLYACSTVGVCALFTYIHSLQHSKTLLNMKEFLFVHLHTSRT